MRYHNITHDDMLNGEGIRVVLWVAGCEHHCEDCHNPITWNPQGGKLFTVNEMDEIDAELSKDYVAGVTFSGGDPLHPENRELIWNLIIHFKLGNLDKTVWMYTGYTWEEIIKDDKLYKCIEHVDVLVDGKFEKELVDKKYKWAGSKNQRVIDVQKSIKKGKVVLYESH